MSAVCIPDAPGGVEVSSWRKVKNWRGEKRSNDHEDRARPALNNERGIGMRSTSYIVNNPRFKEAIENEDLLGPGYFLIWEKPWTQCFLLHGTFSTVRFAERGKREPAKRHSAEEAFWPIFGTCMGRASGDIRMVLFSSIPRRCVMPGATVWFPFCLETNFLAAAKILPIERTPMTKSVSRGTKKLDTIPKKE
jgi:hypothetical protein